MSVTPDNFLQSAEAIASANPDEMGKRNVLSRAYYSGYHCAESIVPNDEDSKTGMHRRYIDKLLNNEEDSVERRIGRNLQSMYSRRVVADYKLNRDIRLDAVPLQLASAREIFSFVAEDTQSNESVEPKEEVKSASIQRPKLTLVK